MSESLPPNPPSVLRGEDTAAPEPVAVRGRLRVVPLLLLGVVVGVIAAIALSRIPGTAPPLAAARLLENALQAVTGAEAEEKIIFGASAVPPAVSPDLLPAGVPAIYCFYEVPGVKTAAPPVVTLLKDGKRAGVVPVTDVKVGTRSGTGIVTLRAQGGFKPGVYEVDLQFADSHVMASFVAAAGAEAILALPAPRDAQMAINGASFASAVRPDGQRKGPPRTAFGGLERVFFVFRYDQAEPGSAVQVKWYGGKELIEAATREILLPSVHGWAHAWVQAPPPGLPPGNYRAALNMSSDPHELAGAEFTVSAGQPPSPASGVPNPPPPR